eukprot:410584-Ditylum_brightwellii.AAC.1
MGEQCRKQEPVYEPEEPPSSKPRESPSSKTRELPSSKTSKQPSGNQRGKPNVLKQASKGAERHMQNKPQREKCAKLREQHINSKGAAAQRKHKEERKRRERGINNPPVMPIF